MKVMVAGTGFISAHLIYPKIKDHFDLSSKQIEAIIDFNKPDVLINCIGKTGRPNIDSCEINKEETALANTAIPILLADICNKKSIHLINISSGCIFYGNSPNIDNSIDLGWKENDFANPKSFYSKTKYSCDLILGNINSVTTLRIRMPLSSKDNPRNLINKLKNYNKIIDIPNSITFMEDLVNCIDWTIKNSKTGIFHVTNPEPLTAVDIMQEYKKYYPNHNFSIISEDELDNITIAKRSNCILNTDKLKNAGFHMNHSNYALSKCMSQYIKNIIF